MEELELLFFDTFSHESSEEINLDLVQFPKPVFIGEIRIIPLGARVQADFPGGVRLGATNPSQFKIEFFVNDLTKPGASTFESLGAIDYNQNGNIHVECQHRIPTDGLVLRGWYSTITLAVYGALTKAVAGGGEGGGGGAQVVVEPPPPGPGPSVTTAEWVQQHAQVGDGDHGGGYAPPLGVEGYPGGGGYPRPPTAQEAEGYHPPPPPPASDYPRHASYQWNAVQGCHGDNYDGNKDGYEGEGWDVRAEEKPWERAKERLPPPDPQSFRGVLDERSPEYCEQEARGTPEYDGRRSRDYYGGGGGWGAEGWGNSPPQPPRKRPRTPPPPPNRMSPSERSASLKREESSPPPFESLSPGDVESISEGDIPETEACEELGGRTPPPVDCGAPPGTPPTAPPAPASPPHDEPSLDAEQFEPILSDDDIGDDTDHQFQDMDYDFNDYTDDPVKTFNPYTCEILPLVSLDDPALSPVEQEEKKLLREKVKSRDVEEEGEVEAMLTSVGDPRENRELWVETAEQIVMANLPKTLSRHKQDVVDKLIDWVDFGLDFDEAMNQPQPGLKIRHIKAGIRLVESLAQASGSIALRMVEQANCQNRLIEIYHRDYMALSIKLMILRSLDSTLRYKECVEKFIETSKKEDAEKSGYQKLIAMIESNQLARVRFGNCSLLQKIHFYELLTKFDSTVRVSLTEIKKEKMDDGEDSSDIDSHFLSLCLESILNIFLDAPFMFAHPKRFMPVSSQFDITREPGCPDPYKTVYTYFLFSKLLSNLVTLLSHPKTSCNPSIVAPIHGLLSELLETDEGLKFLASSPETNPLVRALLGGNPDDNEIPGSNPTLGLHMAYKLQALSYLDSLNRMEPSDPDRPEILDSLQGLFCLTLSNLGCIGKISVVHILSRGDNVSILLKFLKTKPVLKRRSPSRGYIWDLLTLVVKHSPYVPFLREFGQQISELAAAEGPELMEIQKWLKPVDNPAVFSYENISPVYEFIKNNVETCTSLPGEMVTAVRILQYLGIPLHEQDLNSAIPFTCEFKELKYKCVILQMFSLDGVSHLTTALQKLCEYYEQPVLHSARLAGRQGLMLLAFVLPAVRLLRRMLTYVIRCRNTDFKDLTAIPVLLQTYTLMQSIPMSAHAHTESQRVCREIVETLLAYTQPISSETCTESEALNKSLWTSMVAEVFKFTITLPCNFVPGLMILSELLPLPLPLQTKNTITDEEISRAVNSRKLWSAHLHSLNATVEEIITTMSGSSYQPFLQLLRRICVQLADLAAPTALVVTRSLMDSICEAVNQEVNASPHLTRLLNFMACLVTHGPVKSALLNLITKNPNLKMDDKYPNVIHSFIQLLKTTNLDNPSHAQAQECFVSIVQTLCDTEVSLVPPPGLNTGSPISVTNEMYLANALPNKELLLALLTAMLEHISSNDNSVSTMLPVIRTLLLLTEHDYGFYHLKMALERRPGSLNVVLHKVAADWSKDSPLCLATVSAVLELIKTLTSAEGLLPLRTPAYQASVHEAALALAWPSTHHPLLTIEQALKSNVAEDETLEPLLENVTGLIHLLEEEGHKLPESKEMAEPLLLTADSLLVQFSSRLLLDIGEGDDVRLSTGYWLSSPSLDDTDVEMDQVSVDLVEIAKSELSEVALTEEVARVCRSKTSPGDLDANPTPTKKRLTEPNTKRPFVAPMRGRGWRGGRGGGDVFRSRPPNTSRPPSLHVDDFVALETCGAQPTGPTGYNKVAMRAAQDLIATRTRGRGRTFGIDRGGRFFSVAQTYHREAGLWESQVEGAGAGSGGGYAGREEVGGATAESGRGSRAATLRSWAHGQLRFFTR